jgi:hypothetical protein
MHCSNKGEKLGSKTMCAILAVILAQEASAHGNLVRPPSTRQGYPKDLMFSQPSNVQPNVSIITGPPTLNDPKYRTVNINVSSGPGDWTRTMPWRWPGSAAVLGSGCGMYSDAMRMQTWF